MGWFGTFGFWRRKKPEMLEDPKGLLIENFSTSTDEFYHAIQEELFEKKTPDIEISRELFAEGGLLSSKREYLRMRRERLLFDVCAAPFGTSFFFSIRFAEIPVVLYLWQLLLVLVVLAGIGFAYFLTLGIVWGNVMFALNLIAVFALLPNLVALKLQRLDDFLMQLPVFGIVYEAWFRPETYYRIDRRAMYIESIKLVVQRHIEKVTGQQGIQLVEIDSLQPREIRDFGAMFKRWTK
jgi:hypothetical protein